MPTRKPAPAPAAVASAAVHSESASTSSDTVVFACKHPPGLKLVVWVIGAKAYPALGRPGEMVGEPKAFADPHFKPVMIHGPAVAPGQIPKGVGKLVNGYCFTPGVNREFAERYMEQNAESAFIENGIVFFEDTVEQAMAHAREMKGVHSGLEQLDPTKRSEAGRMTPNDYRWPVPLNTRNIGNVETEDPDT